MMGYFPWSSLLSGLCLIFTQSLLAQRRKDREEMHFDSRTTVILVSFGFRYIYTFLVFYVLRGNSSEQQGWLRVGRKGTNRGTAA